jgi:hypothetical protein
MLSLQGSRFVPQFPALCTNWSFRRFLQMQRHTRMTIFSHFPGSVERGQNGHLFTFGYQLVFISGDFIIIIHLLSFCQVSILQPGPLHQRLVRISLVLGRPRPLNYPHCAWTLVAIGLTVGQAIAGMTSKPTVFLPYPFLGTKQSAW